MGLDDGARKLIGFCINGGSSQPKNTGQKFSNWNEVKRDISKQLYKIRHWKIIQGSHSDIDNQVATWFIDPPYQIGGEWYVIGSDKINYPKLALWCKSRHGQVIVCENTKANWLPFYAMRDVNGQMYKTTEAIWCNEPHNFLSQQIPLF
jgi:16S rRNA G966 N2-methylase RsmD